MIKNIFSLPADITALLWICFCTFSAYHAPQSLFPYIQNSFGVTSSSVTLITTCVIFPLGLSPIFYGLILGKLPLVRTLTFSLTFYSLALLPAPCGGSWYALLGGRLLQGFTLPAIILCAMTYISTRYNGKQLQRYMGYYATACMIGGFAGRLFSGTVEQITGNWRMSFAFMALTVATALPCTRLLFAVQPSFSKPDFHAIQRVLKQKNMLGLLCIAPCIVLANNSLLNVLPFRLRDIAPEISPLDIGMVYTGVILCSTAGIFAPQIIKILGSEMKALLSGILLFLFFMPLLFAPSPAAIFFILIGLNFGYAFMYACLPGIINRYSTAEKSVTNGIFLTMYYLSGAIGSYFPTLIFENCGFSVYWICMFAISAIALLVAFQLRNITIDSPR